MSHLIAVFKFNSFLKRKEFLEILKKYVKTTPYKLTFPMCKNYNIGISLVRTTSVKNTTVNSQSVSQSASQPSTSQVSPITNDLVVKSPSGCFGCADSIEVF